eukprot:757951-Pyramimonas_sp.AAC.1
MMTGAMATGTTGATPATPPSGDVGAGHRVVPQTFCQKHTWISSPRTAARSSWAPGVSQRASVIRGDPKANGPMGSDNEDDQQHPAPAAPLPLAPRLDFVPWNAR